MIVQGSYSKTAFEKQAVISFIVSSCVGRLKLFLIAFQKTNLRMVQSSSAYMCVLNTLSLTKWLAIRIFKIKFRQYFIFIKLTLAELSSVIYS